MSKLEEQTVQTKVDKDVEKEGNRETTLTPKYPLTPHLTSKIYLISPLFSGYPLIPNPPIPLKNCLIYSLAYGFVHPSEAFDYPLILSISIIYPHIYLHTDKNPHI